MPVPVNTIRANIRATVGTSEELVHTLHFERVNTGSTDDPSLDQIAARVVQEWTGAIVNNNGAGATLSGWLRPDLVYRTVDVYSLNESGHATGQAQAEFGATAKGTASGIALPPEVACVVSLRTGIPGRSTRGRLYMGGFVIAAVAAGGVVHAGCQDSLVYALEKFGEGMKYPVPLGTDRLNWVVLSRTLTQTNRVTEVRVGTLWDVQRRRQNGLTETYVKRTIDY